MHVWKSKLVGAAGEGFKQLNILSTTDHVSTGNAAFV
jgi:hypothetical protein